MKEGVSETLERAPDSSNIGWRSDDVLGVLERQPNRMIIFRAKPM